MCSSDLRASDGVGFFKQGNNLMAQLVLAALSGAGAKPEKTARKSTATAGTAPEKPLFGQTAADGIDIVFKPEDFSLASLGAGGASALASIVAPGSDAEKLFVKGEAPLPPAGRSDDFRLPAQ